MILQTAEAPVKNRGWIVTFSALGINLVLGVLYAWSPIGKALMAQHKWDDFHRNIPFAAATAMFAITMIYAGRVQDRIGPRKIATLGGIILGLGLIASGFVSDPWIMSVTFGLMGGAGIGLGYAATTPPAVKWFPAAQKGLITGLVVSGVGLAAVYMAPLAQFLMGSIGIQKTFLIFGIGTVIVVVSLTQFLTNPPHGYKPVSEDSTTSDPKPSIARTDSDWNKMLTTPQFYFLWLMYVLSAAPGLMLIANAANIAMDQANWKAGFAPVMTLAIFNTMGRVISGYISDAIGLSRTMMLVFLLQALNMYLFSSYITGNMILFGAAFTGLCYGGIFTLMPAATADYYGLKNLGVNYGILFTAFGVAGVLGSLLGGQVRKITGSYHNAYIILAIMLVCSSLVAAFMRAPKSEMQDHPVTP